MCVYIANASVAIYLTSYNTYGGMAPVKVLADSLARGHAPVHANEVELVVRHVGVRGS